MVNYCWAGGHSQVISVPQVNLTSTKHQVSNYNSKVPNLRSSTIVVLPPRVLSQGNTHCKPTRLKVNNAMRVDSLFPLMNGVPAHRAACGMVLSHVGACVFSPLFTRNWSSQSRGSGLGQGRDQFEEAQT